jgi:hypothetical protein
MPRSLICNKEGTSQEARLLFNATIVVPLAIAIEGGAGLVPKKTVGQFVHNITALPIRMMPVVVDNGAPDTARNCHG